MKLSIFMYKMPKKKQYFISITFGFFHYIKINHFDLSINIVLNY